jgi:hypothetical protein
MASSTWFFTHETTMTILAFQITFTCIHRIGIWWIDSIQIHGAGALFPVLNTFIGRNTPLKILSQLELKSNLHHFDKGLGHPQ